MIVKPGADKNINIVIIVVVLRKCGSEAFISLKFSVKI